MIDHIGFPVSDYERARTFYIKALAPLGYSLIMEVRQDANDTPAAGYGAEGKPDFWIGGEGGLNKRLHVAILARDRATVDAFHAAAIAAGGRDNGAPGLRPRYHASYYGAFVLDSRRPQHRSRLSRSRLADRPRNIVTAMPLSSCWQSGGIMTGIRKHPAIRAGSDPTEVPTPKPGRPTEPPREDPPGNPQPGPDIPPPRQEPDAPVPPQELPGQQPDELPPRSPPTPPAQPPATM